MRWYQRTRTNALFWHIFFCSLWYFIWLPQSIFICIMKNIQWNIQEVFLIRGLPFNSVNMKLKNTLCQPRHLPRWRQLLTSANSTTILRVLLVSSCFLYSHIPITPYNSGLVLSRVYIILLWLDVGSSLLMMCFVKVLYKFKIKSLAFNHVKKYISSNPALT